MDLAYMENEATCFQIPFTWRNETFFRTCPLHQQILLVFPAKFVQFQPLTHPPLHYIKSWFWSFLHTVLEIRRRLPLLFPAELSLAVLLLSLLPNSLHLLFFTSRLCDSVCACAQSCLTLCNHELQPARFLCPWDSPEKKTEADCHFLLQGIIPTQGLTCISCVVGRSFTVWTTKWTYLQIRKRLTDLEEWTYGCWGEGIVREFGINMYALLHLKWITNKDPLQQGTLLNVMWQPGLEGSLGENAYMYMYDWVSLLFNWNYHNIVNWLYPNTKF